MAILKNTTISDTGYLRHPVGTTAQRPASPSAGMIRFNTDINNLEYYNGTTWVSANDYNNIVTSGLVLQLDAANTSSYPGVGNIWYDLSGNGNNFTIDNAGFTYNSSGFFSMADGGITRNSGITTSSLCTCVFWMRTTDIQSLFWKKVGSTNAFLAAYRIDNKFYNNEVGSPSFFVDTVSRPNVYDYIRDNQWHMIEFKSVDFSTWSNFEFNKYNSYTFADGSISQISIYNRNLTAEESVKNFNALRSRYGI